MIKKCNHNIKSRRTSITILPDEFMVFPPQKFGFCPVCQKVFKFQVQDDNSLILVEEEDNHVNE